jgi:predicted deacylase
MDWDILIFKFGNPNAPAVMVDSYLHGNEYYGYQVLKSIATWLITSGDPDAARILQTNYVLFVSVANYHFGRTNYNVPSWMSTEDPSYDGGLC